MNAGAGARHRWARAVGYRPLIAARVTLALACLGFAFACLAATMVTAPRAAADGLLPPSRPPEPRSTFADVVVPSPTVVASPSPSAVPREGDGGDPATGTLVVAGCVVAFVTLGSVFALRRAARAARDGDDH